jgi:hypothetical protein
MTVVRAPRARSRDTTAAAESIQLQVYREMSAERKLELVEDANQTARLLALAGLAARFPDASEEELHLRLFHLVLGTELATRAYGPLPEPPPA